MFETSVLPQCHAHDRRFVGRCLSKFPRRFRPALGRRYEAHFRKGDTNARREANQALLEHVDTLPPTAFRLAADDDELRAQARLWAARCQRAVAPIGGDEEAYRVAADFALALKIQPPDPIGSQEGYRGAVCRLTDEYWWRRAIRRDHGRKVEGLARELFLVHKSAGIYSSDETVFRVGAQRRRNYRMLQELLAVNELGDTYTLAELAELSVSNPAIRRGELMVRIAGFELVADDLGHVGEFITLTCPSRMHAAMIGRGSRAIQNPKHDGTNPHDAQKYLSTVWARIRAKLARHGIKLYGFRVAEPNHDGCPHWHLLVFIPAWARRRVRQTFLLHGLMVDRNEPGARKHRVKFKAIDRAKGTAAGYIAKYIAKNIDGFRLDADSYGGGPVEAAGRVSAWAACWGIRQFQQLGGPPVMVWRELRRLDTEEDGILEEARACADTGDWAGFVQTMGGPTAGRKQWPIRPAYWQEINRQTGEIPLNRYGEAITGRIFGLKVGDVYHVTRWHKWQIGLPDNLPPAHEPMYETDPERWSYISDFTRWGPPGHLEHRPTVEVLTRARDVDLSRIQFTDMPVCCPLEITPDGGRDWVSLAQGGAARPWSSVNNCTTVIHAHTDQLTEGH